MLILDLWGISFHAAVVFGLGKDFLFKSALRHCESLHDTKTVNYHYRPSFSDLTKDLINFLPHIQNQEHQLITEQHNESYGSEQDIVYGEIELVKKSQMYHSIFVIQSFTKLFKFQGSDSQSIKKHNNETCDSEPILYGENQLVKKIINNAWIISYSKCSNFHRISKLLLNFECLFTFCYLDRANSIKIAQ